jgi:hypothetical protein
MKNKIIMTLLATALLAASIFSCNTPDLVPEPLGDFTVIDGDTIKIKINKDISKIKQKDLDNNKYVIVGDTVLKATNNRLHDVPKYTLKEDKIKNGVQNGGYFNEGMATSYPSLIARQMKLAKFKQPEFEKEDYNGYGRKVETEFNPTGGPLKKFKTVNNNLGIESVSEDNLVMKKLNKTDLDAVNMPFGNRGYIFLGKSDLPFSNKKTEVSFALLARLFQEDKTNIYDYYKKYDFDFYTYDSGYDNLIRVIFSGDGSTLGSSVNTDNTFRDGWNMSDSPELTLLRNIHSNIEENRRSDIKGFLANIPDVLSFPVFHLTNKSDLANKYGYSLIYVRERPNDQVRVLRDDELLVPTSSIDSLLSNKVNIVFKKGLRRDNPLTNVDVLGGASIKIYTEFVNNHFANLGKKYGVNIVDLNTLFRQVIEGKYITHDGQRADASYPDGNFFNADGISLSPFGQAIVANEFLRVMNKVYETNIPLINTSHYLERK